MTMAWESSETCLHPTASGPFCLECPLHRCCFCLCIESNNGQKPASVSFLKENCAHVHTHRDTQHSTTQSRLLEILHRSPGGVRAYITYTKQVENPFLNICYPKSPTMLRPASTALSCPHNVSSPPLTCHLPFLLGVSELFVPAGATKVPFVVLCVPV